MHLLAICLCLIFPAVTVLAQPNNPPETTIVDPDSGEVFDMGRSARMRAEGYDPDGDAISFYWNITFPDGTLFDAQGEEFQLTLDQVGTYIAICTAKDEHGLFDPSPAAVSFEVQSDRNPVPPETTITRPEGDVEIFSGDVVEFRAEGEDANGDRTDILWEANSRAGTGSRSASGERIVFDFSEPGIYDVTATAIDSTGQEDPTPDGRVVTVVARDMIDTVITTPPDGATVLVGQPVVFQADSNLSDATFHWELVQSGANPNPDEFEGDTVSFVFDAPGVYEVICAARTDSQRDDTPAQVTVNAVNLGALISSPTPRQVEQSVGETILFQAEVFSPTPPTYAWFIEGKPGILSTELSLTLPLEVAETFTVIFEAQAGGLSARDYRVVRARDNDRFGIEIIKPEPHETLAVGELLTLEANLVGTTVSTVKTTWTFNGRTYQGLQIPNLTIQEPGDYLAVVTGENRQTGFVAEDTLLVKVLDPETDLVAEILRPLTNLTLVPGDILNAEAQIRNARKNIQTHGAWILIDLATEEIIASAARLNLGNYQVPMVEGDYLMRFIARDDAGREASDERRIRVRETRVEDFGNNNSFANAALIEAGRFRNINLNREHFFKLDASRLRQRMEVTLDTNGPVTMDVYLQIASGFDLLRSVTLNGKKSFQLVGLGVGSYILRIRPLETKRDLDFGLGVSVLLPSLFFPEIAENTQFGSEIGLINPSLLAIDCQLIALNAAGNIIAQTTRTLGPKSRIHAPLDQWFPESAGIDWVRVDASGRLVGYTLVKSHDGEESYAIHANEHLSRELQVPHMAQNTEQWYSRASIINGSADASQVTLESDTFSQPLDLSPSFSRQTIEFDGMGEWGRLLEDNNQLRIAAAEVFGKLDGNRQVAGLVLPETDRENPNFFYVSKNIYFTHIARDTNQFWTGLAFVNLSDTTQTARLVMYGDGGTFLGQLDMMLSGHEKKVSLAESMIGAVVDPSQVAWVALQADQDVVGYTLFGTHDNLRLAGIESGVALLPSLCMPYLNNKGSEWFGISVVNVLDEQTTVTFDLYNDVGSVIAQVSRTLAAHEKLAITATELFGTLPPASAWIECRSDRWITGFELIGDTAGRWMAAVKAL